MAYNARKHYEIEKELACRLREAPRDARTQLYSSIYEELFRRVPDHPQLRRKLAPHASAASTLRQVRLLRRFLLSDTTFLEIGAGDCALSFEVAKRVRKVYGLDVSEKITGRGNQPDNFELILSDGSTVPLPDNAVDVAYSNQLIEHLHPEDAVEQLHNIHRVLVPRGVYVCVTPNRLSGPHDISRAFDPISTGLHLKEYTVKDLRDLFQYCGFRRLETYIGAKGYYYRVPLFALVAFEKILDLLPFRFRRLIAGFTLPNIRLAGWK